MKNIRNIILGTAIVAISVSCGIGKKTATPFTSVRPLGDSLEVKDGSLVYALPMTVFEISFEFQRMVEKPGPYAKYASEMLGLRDVITKENEKWSITKIGVKTVEELDPSEYYVIESNVIVTTNALSLKRNGLIMDINPSLYDTRERAIASMNGTNNLNLGFNDLGADEYFQSQSDTAYRIVRLDTAFIRIPYLVERKKALTTEQLADRAAKAILELRDGKQFILTGEANVFPQSSAGIDEINRLETEYTALFAGKRATETRGVTYYYVPPASQKPVPHTLFRFSESAGPLEPASSEGIPVVAEIIPAQKVKDITIIARPADTDKPVPSYDKLFYRIPEVVNLKVQSGGRSLYETRRLVYQMGQVMQLPANYIIGK